MTQPLADRFVFGLEVPVLHVKPLTLEEVLPRICLFTATEP
jgi:hypothetical protein